MVLKATDVCVLEGIKMISKQRSFPNFLIVLIVIMAFFLVGCVRPVPEGEATAVAAEPDTSDPNVGGGTSIDPTDAPEMSAETEAEILPTEADTSSETESYPVVEAENTEETAVVNEEQPVEDSELVEESADVVVVDDATTEPTEQTVEETAATSTTETAAADTECPKEHVVQPGENLFRIGLQYGLSWVTLAQYNGITNPNNIAAGQTIQIPCEGATLPPVQPTPPPENVTYYTVQRGDNLFRIGLQFGVSWVEIAEANGIVNPNNIYAGQVLKIPTSAPGPRPEFTHVVKQGETVYSISVQYGVPAAAIAEANNLQEPYVIYAGQTLIIPGNG